MIAQPAELVDRVRIALIRSQPLRSTLGAFIKSNIALPLIPPAQAGQDHVPPKAGLEALDVVDLS